MEAYEIIVVAFLVTFIVSIFLGYPIAWTLGGLSLIFTAGGDRPARLFRRRHVPAHALGQFCDHRRPHLRDHVELGARRLAHVRLHGPDARPLGRRRKDDDEFRPCLSRHARRPRHHGGADGHSARGLHRHRRRVGGAAGDAVDPDHDAAELFEGARFRRGRGGRHARHSDSAVDHAGDHGRPALDFGRRPVHGRVDPGGGARVPVSRLCHHRRPGPAGHGARAARGRTADRPRDLGRDPGDRSHRRPDHRGAGHHLHRLRHTERSVRRRRLRRDPARAVQRAAQSAR